MRRRRWSNTTNTTRQQGKVHTTQQHTSKVAKASKASKHAPTATRKDTLRAHATRSNVKKEGKKATTKEKAREKAKEKAKEKARRGVETRTKHKNRTNPTQIRPFRSWLKSIPSHYTAQMRAKAILASMPTTTVPTTPAGQSDATITADSHNSTRSTSRRCHSWHM